MKHSETTHKSIQIFQGTYSSPTRSPHFLALFLTVVSRASLPSPWWLINVLADPFKMEKCTLCSLHYQTTLNCQLLFWNWVVPRLYAKQSLPTADLAAPSCSTVHPNPLLPFFSLLPLSYSRIPPSLFSYIFFKFALCLHPCPPLSHFSSCHFPFSSPPQKHVRFSTNRYLGLDQWLLLLAFFCLHKSNIPSETRRWWKLAFRGMGKPAMTILPPRNDTEMEEDVSVASLLADILSAFLKEPWAPYTWWSSKSDSLTLHLWEEPSGWERRV